MASRDFWFTFLRLDTRSGALGVEAVAMDEAAGGVIPLGGGAPVAWQSAPAGLTVAAALGLGLVSRREAAATGLTVVATVGNASLSA